MWVSSWRALRFQPFNWKVGWNLRRQSKNIEMEYETHIKRVYELYGTCVPVQCEELRINHPTLLLVVLVLVAGILYWKLQVTSSFCNLGLHFEGLFWERYISKGQIAFEGHWRLQSWSLPTTTQSGPIISVGGKVECATLRTTSHRSQEPRLWSCESPNERVGRPSQHTSKLI